jgi:hypothetical protein
MRADFRPSSLAAVVLGVPGVLCAGARAQEANLTEAATQPAVGRLDLRVQYRYTRFVGGPDDARRDVADHEVWTKLTLGLTPTLSASIVQPMIVREDLSDGSDADDEAGAGDTMLELKWRFWQDDPSVDERTGALDTTRMALLAGLELPTGTGDLSGHAFDPSIGWVFTAVRGRHGFNQVFRYTFATGTDERPIRAGDGQEDLFEFDSAYLFRLAPGEWTADSHGAWYLTAEVEGFAETNGDTEVLVSPGILYEGRRTAFEASVRLPALQDVDHRPEVDLGLVLGLRVLF